MDYDLCVIGGGVNGAGIARDAAGRGLSVLLLEAADLAGATSSASTKLIHGGLRYLEYFEFDMVRHALIEREKLLNIAPHIIWPMDFVLPHTPEQRPTWMIRLGLFLYDHLARRKILKPSRALDFNGADKDMGGPLNNRFSQGFSYSDCWVDDSRLVALNAVDAARLGATILTHTACVGLMDRDGAWDVSTKDMRSGEEAVISASMVINAAGPWVSDVLQGAGLSNGRGKNTPKIRLVKGSHIITKRLHDGEHAYILQQKDNRICFVIPYEQDYTLIGTTEEDYDGDARDARLSDDEMAYLVAAYNDSFAAPISKDDVIWSYSGVRPLFSQSDDGGDATSATRDYKLHRHDDCGAPLMSVFGGKLTTYRILAEQAMNEMLHLDNRYAPPWTAHVPLPGGDIDANGVGAFIDAQCARYDWLHRDVIARYARSYGRAMDVFLSGAKSVQDLGVHLGCGLYEAEVVYLLRYEFAASAEDILWRRSKLGLHVDDDVVQALETYLERYHAEGIVS